MPETRNILFVRLHGLGDVLMTTPAIGAAYAAWPSAKLDMLVGRDAAPAVHTMPFLHDLIVVDERWFFQRDIRALAGLAARLRGRHYDLVVLFSRSAGLHFWARLTGAGKVISHRRWCGLIGALKETEHQHAAYEADKNLNLLGALGISGRGSRMLYEIRPQAHAAAAAILGNRSKGRWIVLAPGGGENAGWQMHAKRWPAERFAAVAELAYRLWGMEPVVVGAPGDGQLVSRIAACTDAPIRNAVGAADLEVAAALIAKADLLVCNDSVAMHLGLMLDRPTVAIFGPTNPLAVLPHSLDRLKVIRSSRPCAPCFWQDAARIKRRRRTSGFACMTGRENCMAEISVEQVWTAARELMAGGMPC
jgi:lipopolysaccharide heptosyltransferase II